MIGDRTLLASASANTSAITLSEPASNFQWLAFEDIRGAGQTVRILGGNYSQSRQRIPSYSTNNQTGYVPWINQFSSTGRQGFSAVNFQSIRTVAGTALNLYGSADNRADNLKFFKGAIYGEGRLSGSSGTSTGIGSPGPDFVKYDETLLYSAAGTTTADVTLSEPASAFRRLRVVVGLAGESRNVNEIPAPSVAGQVSVVTSIWGTNSSTNAYCFATYTWWTNMTTMHPYYGRDLRVNWNSASAMPTGNWASGNTTSNAFINRPIVQVYGINRIA